jgi:hypothetical protein
MTADPSAFPTSTCAAKPSFSQRSTSNRAKIRHHLAVSRRSFSLAYDKLCLPPLTASMSNE